MDKLTKAATLTSVVILGLRGLEEFGIGPEITWLTHDIVPHAVITYAAAMNSYYAARSRGVKSAVVAAIAVPIAVYAGIEGLETLIMNQANYDALRDAAFSFGGLPPALYHIARL